MSSIAGFHFVFESTLKLRHKYFWLTILVMMVVLSFYWSCVLFINWQSSPVQTTLMTSALDIKEVPFPSFTICPDGYYQESFINKLNNMFTTYFDSCINTILGVIIYLDSKLQNSF